VNTAARSASKIFRAPRTVSRFKQALPPPFSFSSSDLCICHSGRQRLLEDFLDAGVCAGDQVHPSNTACHIGLGGVPSRALKGFVIVSQPSLKLLPWRTTAPAPDLCQDKLDDKGERGVKD